MTMLNKSACSFCGMVTTGPREYHPYAACVMFKHERNGNFVFANLRAVVEYGMKAERSGLTVDQAMNDLTLVGREAP